MVETLFNIDKKIVELVNDSEEELQDVFKKIDKNAENYQYKVIKAMQDVGLAERHFLPATGYGYNDAGREAIEEIFANIFNAEKAIVRPHINSGTHAIGSALYGILRPGDELLAISGAPYDTIQTFIDKDNKLEGQGTLNDFGVVYKQVDFKEDGSFDVEKILDNLNDKTKIVYIQRSTGYSWRKPLDLKEVEAVIKKVKEKKPDVIVFLDNCYGEFINPIEPIDIGVDILAGSLIKNIGGGLAPTGGYVVGREDLIDLAVNRVSVPGLGGETGATMGWAKPVLQGLFFAPTVTASAVKNAILTAQVFKKLGFEVNPQPEDERNDIIQSIKLGDPEAIKIFCRAVQEAAPIDSYVTPEPWDMPGYSDDIIMAAGAFIQGSSIELSADAPIREPYIVYYQGGLTFQHGKLGLLLALQRLYERNLIELK